MSTSLFISDLHLSEHQPEITERFLDFLSNTAPLADKLYILGDFFNFWIGDDYESPLTRCIKQSLNELAKQGTNIYLMHGNRDFLLGKAFAVEAGCQLIPDPIVVKLNDKPTLLLHGDSLCTDDKNYIRFRALARQTLAQKFFLMLPLKIRLKLANKIRDTSKNKTQTKTASMLDVNEEAVIKNFKQSHCPVMIHGHTHKLNTHLHTIGDQEYQRIVLGDWTATQGNFLINTTDGNRFVNFEKAPNTL